MCAVDQDSDLTSKAKSKTWHGVLPEGTRVQSFTIGTVLGRGGFGTTYLATDNLGRRVAIKEYLPDGLAIRQGETMVLPSSTECIEEFQRGRDDFLKEAQILTHLENIPSIVNVYNYLEANGTAYMVMALAVGKPLKDIIKERKDVVRAAPFLGYEELRLVFFSLLEGLSAVHKRGFLHRDIKPANIIVDSAWNPTLIDFGASRAFVAQLSQRTQRTMTSIYTPGYGALEQMNSGRQGAWTDIYGLAATVYAAIVGSPPPDVLTRLDLEKGDPYQPLADMDLPDFPPAFLQAVDAGLILRASDRPQTISAWRQQILARPEDPDDRTIISRKSSRRVDRAAVPREVRQDPAPDLEDSTLQPTPERTASIWKQVPQDTKSGRAGDRGGESQRERSQSRSRPSTGPHDFSLKDFLEEEEKKSAGPGTLAPPVPDVVRAPPAQPRNTRLALVAGGVASIVLLAGGAYVLMSGSAPPPAISQAPDAGNAQKQAAAEKLAAERAEAEKAAADKFAAEQAAARKAAADKAAAERAAIERAAAEKAAADKAAAEKAAIEKAAAEKAATEKAAIQRTAAEKAAAERAAVERAAAEKAAADKVAAERAAAEKAAVERAAAEKAAADKAAAEKAAIANAAADKAAAEKVAAEKAAAEKVAAEKAAADKAAAEVDPKKAEAVEATLRLSQLDRQHIQVALTSLNFNTQGTDGIFGPRSREMIAGWQKAQNQTATGFLTDAQRQDLLSRASAAIARFDEERKNAEAARLARQRAAERVVPPPQQQVVPQAQPQPVPVAAPPAPQSATPSPAQQEPPPRRIRMGPMFN